MKRISSVLFVLLLCYTVNSQNSDRLSLYENFDQLVGVKNTALSYGTIYYEKYRKKNKSNHNFLLDGSFKKGEITYRNQSFYAIDMKYDIVDDFLVIRIKDQDEIISIIPERNLIQHFKIEQFNFKYTEEFGFLEEIKTAEKFILFKKNQKDVIYNKEQDYLHHEFKKKKDIYILYLNNKYYTISSKKDFIKLFPNQKKTITKFYKSNKFNLKNDFKNFVVKLINQLQS